MATTDIISVVLPLLDAGTDGAVIERACLDAVKISSPAVDYQLAIIRQTKDPQVVRERPVRDDPDPIAPESFKAHLAKARELLAR